MSASARPATDRVRVRRGPHKGRYDEATIATVLSRSFVAHVAFVDGDQPCCVPVLYAHVGDLLYVHGSSASRAVRRLGAGAAACVTVTVIDGLVLARSVFEHSANYASLMAFGSFERVADEAEKLVALHAFTEKVLPGRWDEVRHPTRIELEATAVLRLALTEASVKVRSGPPDDDDADDAMLDTWAGVVPIATTFGDPIASPGLRAGIPLSPSIRRLLQKGSVTEGGR